MMERDRRGFSRYAIHERSLEALPALGFKHPTRVQEKVIPLFLSKRNLIVEAPTGTGKTAAYGLPLIGMIDLLKRSTQALVMVPSRELALQVSHALQQLFAGDQLAVEAVYGGTTMEESFTAIKAHPHILVVVPGRLKDVMAHYQYDYLWRDIKFLIVDEGDKLLERGFQQAFDDIRKHVRANVQVGFFSATIPPESTEMMKERFPQVQIVRLKPKELLRNIAFYHSKVKKGQRESYLAGLIQQQEIEKALIFCERRDEIFATTNFLRNCGLKAESYYGNLSQQERLHILDRFKSAHIDFLVASDLAARGLDIEALPAVINLSIPEEFDYYLHRVGRTGRAGAKGKVFNLTLGELDEIRIERHQERIELPLRFFRIEPVDRSAALADHSEKWVKYHLNRGKRDKVRPGDIVGFLVNQAQLNAEEVGTISIYEAYSVVDMPQRGFDTLAQVEGLKLKGKPVRVRKMQVEAQEKKAKAVKKLKQDRRKGDRRDRKDED